MTRLSLCAFALLGVGVLASPALAGGSGHTHDSKSAHHNMPGMEEMDAKLADTAAFGAKGEPKQAKQTVAIEASEIKYDVETLNIRVGETVRFVLTNKGEQPHELTIGDAAYQEVARQMMTHMAEMGMDLASPEHAAMHADAGNTVIAREGETKELAWTFSKPGVFEFSCNMPGHSEVGMKGTITVN